MTRTVLARGFVAALAAAVTSSAVAAIAVFLAMAFWSLGLAIVFGFATFIAATFVSVGHALLLGLPLYLLILRHFSITRIGAAFAGFGIGAVPIGLRLYAPLGVPMAWAGFSGTLDQRGNAALVFGTLGAIGGLAFRSTLGQLNREAEFG